MAWSIRAGLGACLLAALLLAPAASSAQVRFEPNPCPVSAPEGIQLDCGTLTVPEQRDLDTGREVQLAVAIARATKSATRDPVMYLSGGPGGAASTDLPYVLDPGSPVRALLDDRDWIFLDQRGTGFSKPLVRCPEAPLGGPVIEEQDQITPALVCGGRLQDDGVNLAAFSTAEIATDVLDLAHALGHPTVVLYGQSYGTRLALRVMRDHPDVASAAMLDGVFPPQVNGQANIPAMFSRSLQLVFERCAADPVCGERYPNLPDRFAQLLNRLQTDPPSVQYTDPLTDVTSTTPLNGKTFLALLLTLLYPKEGIQLVPALISLTADGDMEGVENLLPVLGGFGAGVGEGVYYSVECTDEGQRPPVPTTPLEPLPGVAVDMPYAEQLSAICASWPAAPQQDADRQPVTSDIPVLLFSGRFDPVTPPDYAVLAAASLSNSTLVEFADQGHVALLSPCAASIMGFFMATPGQLIPIDCAADGALAFAVP